jgi:hypothetical protein
MSEVIIAANRRAKPLALGFGGSFGDPSSTISALAKSFLTFRSTYKSFMQILAQEETTIEFIDDFSQTWDECNDFLDDYENLQHGAAFALRWPATPEPSHGLARYVYTDEDIVRLKKRVGFQLHIMLAKMDDIIL